MTYLTGRALPRRTFLKGLGASLALPYLDAMLPAVGAERRHAALQQASATRFVGIEFVHGAAGCNAYGASKFLWAPEGLGRAFDFVPDSALKPLEPWREYLTIISNTDVRMAEPIGGAGEIGGDNFRSSAVFLTQAHPKQTNGSDVYVGTSIDQLIARRIGATSLIPSLQLCIEDHAKGAGCTYNYACAYVDSLSWSSPTTPMPMMRDPRAVLDRLLNAGKSNTDRADRRRTTASLLDWILADAAELQRTLGPADRRRVEQFLESVRELERHVQRVEARNASGGPRALPDAPPAVPDSFSEHMRLMFDLQVLAFETDLTRVVSFKTGRDGSNRTYPESGNASPFYSAGSYGAGGPAVDRFNLINRYYVAQLAYFAERLRNTPDGDSNLLERSLVIYGSPMADSNLHNHRRCPLIALGHANGRVSGNLHLSATPGTPMANAFVSFARAVGLTDMASFGDASGAMPLSG
jgi:hypothetical protein